jgi:hypothetical protein
MTTYIEPVNHQSIRSAEFVHINMTLTNGTAQINRHLYLSTSYKEEVINGVTYNNMYSLLSISANSKDLEVTNKDTSISLNGISDEFIYFFAGGPATDPIPVIGQSDIPVGYYPIMKGSVVEIYRGFYDTNYVLTGAHRRFTGVITNYHISENRGDGIKELDDTYMITFNCSSFKQVLESRRAGRKTNNESWKYYFPTDTSMDQIAGLVDKTFDFKG